MFRFPAIPARSSVVTTVLLVALAVAVGASAAGRSVTGGFGWKHGRSKLQPNSFRIAANLAAVARPGVSQEVDLRLSNPHHYALLVSRLTLEIVVDATHARAGCDRRVHFRSIPMPPSSYPLTLRPGVTTSLRQLRVAVLPRVVMLALPEPQDACKGARLTLKYGGRAQRTSLTGPAG